LSKLVRLSVSLEKELFAQLKALAGASGYANRSEFIRDLVRNQLVRKEWRKNREVLGTLTILYDHDAYRLCEKLVDLQHSHRGTVLGSLHFHVGEHRCAEVVVMRGRAGDVNAVADGIRSQRGVLHAALSMSSTGRLLT